MCVKNNLLQVPPALVPPEVGLHHLLNQLSPHHPLPLVLDLPYLLQRHQLESLHPLPLVMAHQQAVKGSLQLWHHLREGSLSHCLPLGFLLLQLEKWETHQLFLGHFPVKSIMWMALMVKFIKLLFVQWNLVHMESNKRVSVLAGFKKVGFRCTKLPVSECLT